MLSVGRGKSEGTKVGKKEQRDREKKDDCQVGVFLFATIHMYAPHNV